MSDDRQTTSRFTVLWLKAQPVLTGYVVSLVRDRSAADDLIQSVALTAIEKMDTYDQQRSFEAWVLGIARYKVLQHFRDSGNAPLIFDESLLDAFSTHYTDAAQTYDERLAALRTCMDKLPQDTQDLLARRYFDKQPVKAIARDQGQTPQRISKQLYTIRRALERCINQRLGTEGGAS